jgi:hypothetical protein
VVVEYVNKPILDTALQHEKLTLYNSAATGENLPEAAEITLKQEKEASEQAELIQQQEKVIL